MTTLWQKTKGLFGRGKSPKKSTLTREESAPSTMSVRDPWDDCVATGMTPANVTAMIRAAARGDHTTYLQFAADMERRDPHYYSVLQTRKLAVAQLPREVTPPKGGTGDSREVDLIDNVVNGEGFTRVLLGILDGLGKGFSVSEVVWEMDAEAWKPKKICRRNPKFFTLDDRTASEWRLAHKDYPEGKPLAPYKYIVHEPALTAGLPVAAGLARVCVAMHMFKSFGLRSWMRFGEVFGMPLRIGKYAQGSSPADVATLKRALRDIGSDAAAVFPQGMEIVFERAAMSGASGGDEFFKVMAEFMNSEMSKAVLGQTMTTDDGSSMAQAVVHDKVRHDIRNADAESLEDTLNAQLIRPLIDLNFGPRPSPRDYPRLTFDTAEPEDLVAFSQAIVPLLPYGLGVGQAFIRKKYGIPEPEEGEELLEAPTPQPTEPSNGDESDDEDTDDTDDTDDSGDADE